MTFVIVAVFLLLASPWTTAQLTYRFLDVGSLLAAQKQGIFNGSAPIVVILSPSTYFLNEVIVFSVPALEIRGSSAEIVCDGSGSALQLIVPGSVILHDFSISKCGGSPALRIDTPTSATGLASVSLNGLHFSSNSAGALAIFSISNMKLTMQQTTFTDNGLQSSEATASIMEISCNEGHATSCSFVISNSTWSGNAAGLTSPVASIQGYGSVRMSGLVWTDNTGSGTLSISQTGSAGASLGANGPGASFNVDISGTNFSRNQGFLNGGLFLDDCGSVLIRESSFINNSATSDGGLGGALRSGKSSITVSNSVFLNNNASSGGAIFAECSNSVVNDCKLLISFSNISGNAALTGQNPLSVVGGGAIAARYLLDITISDCLMDYNTALTRQATAPSASLGGAVSALCTPLTASRTRFLSNTARLGGAVSIYCSISGPRTNSSASMAVIFDNCEIIGNSALGSMAGAFGQGGGVYMIGTQTPGYVASIIQSSFVGNYALSSGGAIQGVNVMANYTSTTFVNNTASSSGAGIIAASSAPSGPPIILDGCSFTGNKLTTDGGSGAGLSTQSLKSVSVIKCTFTDNIVVSEEDQTSTGGAIYVGDSPTDIEASTFSGNSAYQGGAVFVARQLYPGSESLTLNMSRSNLIGNTAHSLGGALYLAQLTSASIENCAFLNNAGIEGSAVYASGTPLTAANLQCSGTLASLGKITCASPMTPSPPLPPPRPPRQEPALVTQPFVFIPLETMFPSPSMNTTEYLVQSDSKRSLVIGLAVGLGSLAIIVVAVFVHGMYFHKKGSRDIPSGKTLTEGSSGETSLDGRNTLKEGEQDSGDGIKVLKIEDPNSRDFIPSDESSSGKDSGTESPKLEKARSPMEEVQRVVGALQGGKGEQLIITERLGQGAFGTVYRGRWRNLDVAVKTVLFSSKQGEDSVPEQRAVMEAGVSASVVHPNVVATYHYEIKPVQTVSVDGAMQILETVHRTDWKMFLIQELCNASLADTMEVGLLHHEGSKQAYMDIIFHMLDGIACGMVHIHNKNIIHGDLKPDNVLLKHCHGAPFGVIVKIADFGLCCTLDPTQTHVSNGNKGTPFYAAPEISTMSQATTSSDVFSFGIMMIEMYRNVRPYIYDALKKVFVVNPGFSYFSKDAPQAYVDLALKCTNTDPKARPTFADIIPRLQAMNQYSSTRPPKPSPAQLGSETTVVDQENQEGMGRPQGGGILLSQDLLEHVHAKSLR